MPDPDPKSPAFDFLSDFDSPKRDEPAPTGNDEIFNFEDEGPSDAVAASPPPDPIGTPPDPIGLPADATIPPGKDVHDEDEMGIFDELFANEVPAAKAEEPAPPAVADEFNFA